MNRNTVLKSVLEARGTDEIKRREIIHDAINAGLIEKDTYFLMKPENRGNRNAYSVRKLLAFLDQKLAKKKKVSSKPKTVQATSSDSVEKDICNFEPVAPTQDDIDEELSLMNTHI